jgi:hypothetical protein
LPATPSRRNKSGVLIRYKGWKSKRVKLCPLMVKGAERAKGRDKLSLKAFIKGINHPPPAYFLIPSPWGLSANLKILQPHTHIKPSSMEAVALGFSHIRMPSACEGEL